MIELNKAGYAIVRKVFLDEEIAAFCDEIDRIRSGNHETCLRHVRSRSPTLDRLAVDPRLLGLIPSGLKPVRSLLFDKTQACNWPVAWHQDLTIAVKERVETDGYSAWSEKDSVTHVQPPTLLLQNMVSIRIHIDDTDSDNAELKVVPGSHHHGRLDESAIHASVNTVIGCTCRAGDVLLLSPLILHSSERARHPKRRRVIHFEYAPRELLSPKLEWYECA